jgi:HEAT repeat
MSRRRVLLGAGVLLVVLAGALAQPGVRWPLWGWLRGEAFYRGRPTSYWAGRLKNEPCEFCQNADAQASGGLKVWVETRPAPQRPPPLVGALYRLFRVRPAPSEVLFEGGEDCRLVPVLIELLQDQNPSVVRLAALYLGGLGPAARPAAPALVVALAVWNDEDLRLVLAYALGRTSPRPEEAVRALADILRGQNKGRAAVAAVELGDIGPRAKGAVPALAAALTDGNVNVRCAAAGALTKVDPHAAAVLGLR